MGREPNRIRGLRALEVHWTLLVLAGKDAILPRVEWKVAICFHGVGVFFVCGRIPIRVRCPVGVCGPLRRLKTKIKQGYDSAGKQLGCEPAMGFQVATREIDRIVVVDAVGRLTLSDGRTQLRDLIHVFGGNGRKKFLLNLAGVDFVDAYGIGELARCYSVVRQMGGEMKLVHVSKKVQDLLQITRLSSLFEIHSEEQVALRAFLGRV